MTITKYALLSGVGYLYLAEVGTAFPELDITPPIAWTSLGETMNGVGFKIKDSIKLARVDQRTGPVKPVRDEEDIEIKTTLALSTLENVGLALGMPVLSQIVHSVGTFSTKAVKFYRGSEVYEYALLFRGTSAYGPWPGQYELPRCFFNEIGEINHKKEVTGYPITIMGLEDLSASDPDDRYGRLVEQTSVLS